MVPEVPTLASRLKHFCSAGWSCGLSSKEPKVYGPVMVKRFGSLVFPRALHPRWQLHPPPLNGLRLLLYHSTSVSFGCSLAVTKVVQTFALRGLCRFALPTTTSASTPSPWLRQSLEIPLPRTGRPLYAPLSTSVEMGGIEPPSVSHLS